MSQKPLKKIWVCVQISRPDSWQQSCNFNIHKNQNQIPAVLCMGGQVCQLLSGEPKKDLCSIIAEHFLGETLDSETITFN